MVGPHTLSNSELTSRRQSSSSSTRQEVESDSHDVVATTTTSVKLDGFLIVALRNQRDCHFLLKLDEDLERFCLNHK